MIPTIAWASLAAGLIGQVTPTQCTTTVSLDGTWALAPDPSNVGRDEQWWQGPVEGAKPTPVPWIIQEVFVGYHGVAWYWREFDTPPNPHEGGRYVLRFWAVDYYCDVYLNGERVGSHEGGEDPFEFDVTNVVRTDQPNRLAVRVLNPGYEPIDGFVLPETPHRNKTHPYSPGADFNYGGITDSVELLVTPAVRITDSFVRADPETGEVRVTVDALNASDSDKAVSLGLTAAPAAEGSALATVTVAGMLPPGASTLDSALTIPQPRPWTLSDPYLYRVSARLAAEGSGSFDERSVRTGFRDFRFERGAFRLNGKRIYLKCSHTGADTPVAVRVPFEVDLVRRDLLNVKAMGFNAIRFIAGVANRRQLDLADEIGLLVYEECFAGWCFANSPHMAERFDHSTIGMILRDRNHPSIVIWGLLNETGPGPVLSHAESFLSTLRKYDDTRLVLFNSGRWDAAPGAAAPVGLQAWRNTTAWEPCVIRNTGAEPTGLADSRWQPGQLSLHPGVGGEPAVLRWTAPADGPYAVHARFTGIAEKPTTTDVHILRGSEELFAGGVNVNGAGNETDADLVVDMRRGEILSLVVGIGDGSPYSDTTALDLRITGPDGASWDAATSFAVEANPHGPWEYGWIAADAPLAPESFIPFGFADARFGTRPGSLSNPGSAVWEDLLAEQHPYQRVPHTGEIIARLRTLQSGLAVAWDPAPGGGFTERPVTLSTTQQPLFVSEYGIGSAVDLCRMTRHYEPLGKTHVEDAAAYRAWLGAFVRDFEAWGMDETFASPEDYFRQCLSKMGEQRMLGIDALRSNPNVISYSLTGTQDQALTGEGLTTQFRELKPGTMDALFESFAPLRLCSFAEPVNVYRGDTARLETVLANEDILAPGEYPLRVQLVGPDGVRVFDRTVTFTVPESEGEPPFAIPVFTGDVPVDGPSGRYRFLATLERGGAPTGGEAELYVYDRADMPTIAGAVARFGEDPDLDAWLAANGIATTPLADAPADTRVILVSGACPQDEAAWDALAERVRGGATAVFLTAGSLARGEESLGWLPIETKGALGRIWGWLYLKDEWAKRHPIFDGLQAGGLMDYTVYRDIIPDEVLVGQDPEAEAVAGACKTSQGYDSGLMVVVHRLGKGRLVLNTLLIRENLGRDPVAERLLRNMLRYGEAGADTQ